MNTLKEQSFRTRCIAKALAVAMIVGCLPMTSALGLETESENNKETETVLTYKDSDEGRTLGEFITNEKTDEAWKESFAQFEKELSENGYQNVDEAFDANNMVYVGGENDEKIAVYLKDGEQENIPLSEYDGKGGEHYLWRYCKAEKDTKTESDKTESEVDYFWVRTNKMVDLKKWDADSSKEIQNETDTGEDTTLDETEPLTNGTLQNVFIGGDKASDNNDGAGVESPVATYGKAKELLAPGGTIWVLGMIKVTENAAFGGANNTDTFNLKRWVEGSVEGQDKETYSGYLIEVDGEGVTLTLQNITIDGGSVEQEGALIHNTGKASIVLNSGATLQNNYANKDLTTSANAGAIVVGISGQKGRGNKDNKAIVVNEGAVVSSNFGVRAGAFSIKCEGIIEINGGVIEKNSAEVAGAIFMSGVSKNTQVCTINDGEIYNNTAKTSGGIVALTANVNISGGKMHDNNAEGGGKLPYVWYDSQEEATLARQGEATAGFLYSEQKASVGTNDIKITGGEIYKNRGKAKTALDSSKAVAGAILIDSKAQGVVAGIKMEISGGSIHDNYAATPRGDEKKTGGVVLGAARLVLFGKPQIYDNYLEKYNSGEGSSEQTGNVCNVRKTISEKSSGMKSDIEIAKHLEKGSYIGVTYIHEDVFREAAAKSRDYGGHQFYLNNQDAEAFHNDRETNGQKYLKLGIMYGTDIRYGGTRFIEENSTMCPLILNLNTNRLTTISGESVSGLKVTSDTLLVENIDFSKEKPLPGITHQHAILVIGSTNKNVVIKGDLNVYSQGISAKSMDIETKGKLYFDSGEQSNNCMFTTNKGTALTIGDGVSSVIVADKTIVSAVTKTKNDMPVSVGENKVKVLDLSMRNTQTTAYNLKIGDRTVTLSSGMQRIGVLDNLSGTWLTGDIKVTNEDGESFVRGLAQDESDSYASDEYSQKNLYGDTYPLGLNGNANLGRYQEVRLPVKVKQLNVSVPTAIVFNIYADNSGDGGFIAPEYELQNDSCTYEDQVEVDGNKISFNKKEATVDVSCKGIVATSDSKNEYSIRDFSKMNKETMEQSVDYPVVCLDMTINNGTDKTIFPLDETVKTSSSTIATVIPGSNILQLARPSGYVDDNEKRYYQIPKLIEDGTTRKLAGHHTLSLGFKMD